MNKLVFEDANPDFKKIPFTRECLEHIAKVVWEIFPPNNESERITAELLRQIEPTIRKRKTAGKVYLAWGHLREYYSGEEIKMLMERVRGEGRRRGEL